MTNALNVLLELTSQSPDQRVVIFARKVNINQNKVNQVVLVVLEVDIAMQLVFLAADMSRALQEHTMTNLG